MSRRNLWMIFLVTVISLACYSRATRNPYGRWFAQAMDTIESQYIEPVDPEKLFEGAMRGMVDRLDDYSTFLPGSMKTYFDQALEQKYGGIGVGVSPPGSDKPLVVVSARMGGPAQRAGIRVGDRIVGIDDRDADGMSFDDALDMLRGKPGTAVTVRVQRQGHDAPLAFHMKRALIKVESVLGDQRREDGSWNFMLPGDDRIGYIRVQSFGDLTVDEFEAAIQELTDEHCRGLILDLRDNLGGLLDKAEEMCDLFLPAGAVIVTTRGRDARVRKETIATGDGPYRDLPIVVLVNDQSASAAEIVAACLQDHDRAKVVGERTYGKGTVQNLIPVEAGKSSLKLTIATYWRPSEKNIHRMSSSKETDEWGVKPDPGGEVKLNDQQKRVMREARRRRDGEIVPTDSADDPPTADGPLESDPQLRKAVEILKQQLARSRADVKAA